MCPRWPNLHGIKPIKKSQLNQIKWDNAIWAPICLYPQPTILLVKEPSGLGLTGGKKEKLETIEQALMREVNEELHTDIKNWLNEFNTMWFQIPSGKYMTCMAVTHIPWFKMKILKKNFYNFVNQAHYSTLPRHLREILNVKVFTFTQIRKLLLKDWFKRKHQRKIFRTCSLISISFLINEW